MRFQVAYWLSHSGDIGFSLTADDDKWSLLVNAEGQFLNVHQDKKGALTISPTIVILVIPLV